MRFIVDRVMVMYLGKIAEIGARDTVFDDPRHPYSAALLASMPKMDPAERTLVPPLAGDPPNPIDPPPGCRFHTRCALAEAPCRTVVPPLFRVSADHAAACLMSVAGSGHSRASPAAAEA